MDRVLQLDQRFHVTLWLFLWLTVVICDSAASISTVPANSCEQDEFHCNRSGRCITNTWRCDGDMDCAAGEDEKHCEECTNNAYLCMGNQGRCVSACAKCNGKHDCPDGDDERGCKVLTPTSLIKDDKDADSTGLNTKTTTALVICSGLLIIFLMVVAMIRIQKQRLKKKRARRWHRSISSNGTMIYSLRDTETEASGIYQEITETDLTNILQDPRGVYYYIDSTNATRRVQFRASALGNSPSEQAQGRVKSLYQNGANWDGEPCEFRPRSNSLPCEFIEPVRRPPNYYDRVLTDARDKIRCDMPFLRAAERNKLIAFYPSGRESSSGLSSHPIKSKKKKVFWKPEAGDGQYLTVRDIEEEQVIYSELVGNEETEAETTV